MKKLAPILLFVYNRPQHTKKTVEALLNCHSANQSELYIFSDGSKRNDLESDVKVKQVREYINKIDGFKKVKVIESDKNKGLAKSIIEGVNYVFKYNDTLITLEDDVLVGKYFIDFMNQSLYDYLNEEKVFMISGYLFNLPFQKYKKKSFFLPTGSTQAWATWKDRWDKIDFESKDYTILKDNKWIKFKFNLLGGIKYSDMLIDQMENNNISSWAIRYRWDLFKNKGLTLFPARNMVKNIGWDGSGNHCDSENMYKDDITMIDAVYSPNQKNVSVKTYDYLRLVFFFYKIRIISFINFRFKK